MEIWFGTADDNRTRDVIFKGRPGRFCSIPFFGGGAYPLGRKDKERVNKSPRCTLKNLLKQAGGFKRFMGSR